jgi:sugar lactone lactonase YvrE
MPRLGKYASVPRFPAVLFLIVIFSFSADAHAQKIYTVAGGYVGDGGPATSASLAQPLFAAFDQSGNLYVSDTSHCRIREVDAHGNISTVAGSGICGYGGDGGKAINAKLSYPTGVAVDTVGNVFYADTFVNRIRQIDASGKISTVAGKGVGGYCGDGGSALKACLSSPTGLAVSGSDLYIADSSNCRIRKLSGGVMTTVAGNGTCGYAGDGGPATAASLNAPADIAIYGLLPSQTLWISDSANRVIRRVDMSTGLISTWWGDGNCYFDLQHLCLPLGIAVDAGGDLFVADGGHDRVLGAAAQGGVIVLEAGGQGLGYNGDGILATSAMLYAPEAVAVDNAGNIVTVDTGNNRVRRGGAFQNIATVAGGFTGDGGQALKSSLNAGGSTGEAISFDAAGNLYIADSRDFRIRKVSPTGVIATFAGTGITGYSGDGGPATSATMNDPFGGVAADQHGNVFFPDQYGQIVRKVDSTGTISTFSSPFSLAAGLATDSSGNVYAVDLSACVVWKITSSGASSIVAGVQSQCGFNSDGIPATQSLLWSPFAVAVDSAGNLYIADLGNRRIRKVNSQGTISTVAGNGTGACGTTGDGGPATSAPLCSTCGVALDAAGNLYIADSFNIKIVNSSGIIETLAGNVAGRGYNGNGLATMKTRVLASAVAVSPSGVVYYSDSYSSLVRKIQTTTAASLSSSQNPSVQGQSVTFTATVTGSTGTNPIGTVTFKAGTKSLGARKLSGGKASIETTTLPQGTNTITATFNGGTDFTSSSASLVQTVN